MTPADDERPRIRAAIERILQGRPTTSNGALTIVALAIEADVPRNALTQRHLDLKHEFYARIRERGDTPDSEKRLHQQIAKLTRQRAEATEELKELKLANQALVGALHQLQMENQQLRQHLADQTPQVRILPGQPHPQG